MQRFIDRRTSALMRGLNAAARTILAGSRRRRRGDRRGPVRRQARRACSFEPARGASALEDRRLARRRRARGRRRRSPAASASSPAEEDEAFALAPTAWCSGAARRRAQLAGGGPFAPRVRLLGELGPPPTRERATRRLEAFVAAEASRRLAASEAPEERGRRRASEGTGARPRLPADRAFRRGRPPAGRGADPRPQPGGAAGAEGPRRALRRVQPLLAGSSEPRGAAPSRPPSPRSPRPIGARRPTP